MVSETTTVMENDNNESTLLHAVSHFFYGTQLRSNITLAVCLAVLTAMVALHDMCSAFGGACAVGS